MKQIFFTCANRSFAGPLAAFVANPGITTVKSESAFAFIDDIGADTERASGSGFTSISVAQKCYSAQTVRAGDAQDNAVGSFRQRATDFTTLGCHSGPFTFFGTRPRWWRSFQPVVLQTIIDNIAAQVSRSVGIGNLPIGDLGQRTTVHIWIRYETFRNLLVWQC